MSYKSLNVNKIVNSKIGKGLDYISHTKTKSSNRIISISEALCTKLFELTKNYDDNDFIFGKEKSFRDKIIANQISYYCKISTIKYIRIHDFRHSHASYLYHNKIDILAISKRLGHSTVSETLNTYTHMKPNEDEKIIDLMEKNSLNPNFYPTS